ncbi:hypothetical protein [Burkholderia cepacia]|uniref:hypothetical protein n=1 Tax=Burkholderia cepacia TaxID=292 RepID=UPI00298FDE38|nr:hypothetical protein [Burkholderia cepacia]
MISLDTIPPANTGIQFARSVGYHTKRFDFKPWYHVGIDSITYACQRQIERFIDGQDRELTHVSIYTLCQGLVGFLDYLAQLSMVIGRNLVLGDITRATIDGYLVALGDAGISRVTQKNQYSSTKTVLKELCRRNIITYVRSGDDATFPRNPFPGANKAQRGESPLGSAERKAFSVAVKTAVVPLFSDDVEPNSCLLSYALLIIALHTGRNTWPLLEMKRDCLHAHPKGDRFFLVLYKRRGHSENKVAIRADTEMDTDATRGIESMPTVRPTVARLIHRVMSLSDRLRDEAPEELRGSVWLYRMRTSGRGGAAGQITSLTTDALQRAIRLLVSQYALKDTDGKPLRINISRLRKTFVNRIYEILAGDTVATAAAAGDTVAVTDVNYLRPGESSKENWKFMGTALVKELLTNTLGETERTPVGSCSDPEQGDYAPKREGATCMNFFNCLRCRNYVVTGDDLYRLFSFYWRILSERERMSRHKWRKHLAHIVRLIDRDVIDAGLSKGIFKADIVARERARARVSPHPYWRSDSIIAGLTGIAS